MLVVVFSEPFSIVDIELAEQEINAGQWADWSRLFDFSRCLLSPTTTELLQVGKQLADSHGSDQVKCGWIAATQRDVGLLRIVLGRTSDQIVRVFLSDSEARRWLAGGEKEILESPVRVSHVPVRMRGTISLDEVLRQQQILREQTDYDVAKPILWDLRESTLIESLDEVQTLAVYIASNHNRDRAGQRSAVLIDSHIMGLLFKEMTKVSGWPSDDVAVFRSFREALGWLAGGSDLGLATGNLERIDLGVETIE